MEPDNLGVIRRSNGTFAKGTPPPNPAGRPKGQTMKEFAREFLMRMDPQEKEEWISKLSPDIVWRMAEGNPHQTQDLTSDGKSIAPQTNISPEIAQLANKYEDELRKKLLE